MLNQPGQICPIKLRSEGAEFCATLFQKRLKAGWVVLCTVMKGCSHLDESVQESFLFTCRAQPEGFKRFMCFKVLMRVKQPDAFQ